MKIRPLSLKTQIIITIITVAGFTALSVVATKHEHQKEASAAKFGYSKQDRDDLDYTVAHGKAPKHCHYGMEARYAPVMLSLYSN